MITRKTKFIILGVGNANRCHPGYTWFFSPFGNPKASVRDLVEIGPIVAPDDQEHAVYAGSESCTSEK
jgi:hypothetical protein